MPAAIKRSIANNPFKKDAISLFFLLWASIIFIFFSFSKSKLIPYILPLMPPLAALVAIYLGECYVNLQNIKRPTLLLAIFSLLTSTL